MQTEWITLLWNGAGVMLSCLSWHSISSSTSAESIFVNFIPQERKPSVNEMRRPAQARPLKGGQPSMQFFGPSDFVPELPHNVQVPAPAAMSLQGLDCFHAVRNKTWLTNVWSGWGGQTAGWNSEG